MSRRHDSALDGTSLRDAAMLAEVLRSLRGQLEGGEEGREPTAAEVEDLVSHAVAELQRVTAPPAVGAIAPVLGAGVLQELLRQRREGPPPAHDVPKKVDAKR